MTKFSVPTKEEVSEDNKVLFDKLKNAVGFVPSFVRINFLLWPVCQSPTFPVHLSFWY